VDGGRGHSVRVRFSDAELSVASTGAGRADMRLAGYIAAAALAAAQAQPAPRVVGARERLLRESLAEIAATRVRLVRVGTLLNQAVAALNSTGAVTPGLPYLAGRVEVVVREMDRLTAQLLTRGGTAEP